MGANMELAIVDFNYLLKEFEHCQQYQLVVPHPHIKALERTLNEGKKNVSCYKTQQILDYLQEHAIILKIHDLPKLTVNTKGIKPKACRFARYVLAAREKYPNIKVLSTSRESKYLLKQLNIHVSAK